MTQDSCALPASVTRAADYCCMQYMAPIMSQQLGTALSVVKQVLGVQQDAVKLLYAPDADVVNASEST